MNPEVLSEVLAGSGLVAGAAIEAATAWYAHRSHESVVHTYGPIEGMPEPEQVRTSFARRAGKLALRASLPVVAAVTGGLAPYAWEHIKFPEPQNTNKPVMLEAVDLGGQTLYDGAEQRQQIINHALNNLSSEVKIDVVTANEGTTSQGGNTTLSTLANFLQNPATGTESIDSATSTALDESVSHSTKVTSSGVGQHKEAAPLLLVTDNNSPDTLAVGQTQQPLVAQALKQGSVIDVVNVGSETGPNAQASTKLLKDLAYQTHGGAHVGYWHFTSTNAKQIAKDAKQVVNYLRPTSATQTPPKVNMEYQTMLKVLDLAAASAVIGMVLTESGVSGAVVRRRKQSKKGDK